MFASFFKKSTPINYSLIVLVLLLLFFIVQFQDLNWTKSYIEILTRIGVLALIFASLFLSNFIVKKNQITKDSAYTVLFLLLLLLFFPSIFENFKLLLANFFILLSFRRLISLQTLKAPKEKIFDATLWILLASILHFWCILFIVLVYVSIIFHVSRDYRNWLIPFFAGFALTNVFVFCSMIFKKDWINIYLQSMSSNTSINYFQNNNQNIAFSIFIVLAFVLVPSALFSINAKPLNMQATYKKILISFFIGAIVFLLSPNKSNEFLIFTFFPIAVMGTNFVEYSHNKINQELLIFGMISTALYNFFIQL